MKFPVTDVNTKLHGNVRSYCGGLEGSDFMLDSPWRGWQDTVQTRPQAVRGLLVRF